MMRFAVIAAATLAVSAPAQAMTAKMGVLGCYSILDFDTLTKLIDQKQMELAKELLNTKLKAGECKGYEKGDEFALDDAAPANKMVCARKTGEARCVWTRTVVFQD